VATPNYSYEKRQRELAKKRKKEEKLQRKTGGRAAGDPPEAGQASEAPAVADGATPAIEPGKAP
jgi:hypothetical protein